MTIDALFDVSAVGGCFPDDAQRGVAPCRQNSSKASRTILWFFRSSILPTMTKTDAAAKACRNSSLTTCSVPADRKSAPSSCT